MPCTMCQVAEHTVSMLVDGCLSPETVAAILLDFWLFEHQYYLILQFLNITQYYK